jgi:hypothetical protein
VQDAAAVDRLGDYGFWNTVPVTIGTSTIVSIDGVYTATSLPLSTISVGQRIDVSGQVTDYTDTFDPESLDATAGQVRLQPTSIWGTLNSGTTDTAVISLEWIENMELNYTDFTGTGSSQEAQTTDYVVSTANVTTGSADQSATPAGTLLNIIGLANTFGAGPPYFNATSVTPGTSLPQRLILEYTEPGGSPQPFSTISGSGLFVNLYDGDQFTTVVQQGPQTTNVRAGGAQYLEIIPATTGTVSFTVGNTANGQAVFTDPTAFAAEVQFDTGSVGGVQKIVADGQYDATAGTFTATNIEVVIQK